MLRPVFVLSLFLGSMATAGEQSSFTSLLNKGDFPSALSLLSEGADDRVSQRNVIKLFNVALEEGDSNSARKAAVLIRDDFLQQDAFKKLVAYFYENQDKSAAVEYLDKITSPVSKRYWQGKVDDLM